MSYLLSVSHLKSASCSSAISTALRCGGEAHFVNSASVGCMRNHLANHMRWQSQIKGLSLMRLQTKWDVTNDDIIIPRIMTSRHGITKSEDIHCAKKPVTTTLTYPWKCTVLHCNHLGNTWKTLVLMT